MTTLAIRIAALVIVCVRFEAAAFRSPGVRNWIHRNALLRMDVEVASEFTQVLPDPKLVKFTRLLTDLWGAVAFPDENEEVDFVLSEYDLERNQMEGFINHFQTCKDCAADGAFVMATQNDEDKDVMKLTNVAFSMLTNDGDDDKWGGWDPSLLGEQSAQDLLPIFPIEEEDDVIIQDSKTWVRKVIADFAVCPFTVDPDRAGIPMGGVRYSVSRAVNPDEAFFRYWEEVLLMLQVPEKQVATVLLVFPELELFGNYELFEAYCECLQDALSKSTMGLESEIQLVFFHPKFQFRDGQERSGAAQGAPNYARRSPWPMINILRTPQVRAAQKGVPTGIVYKQNEERLTAVGSGVLEKMLYARDWTGLPMHTTSSKAIRREIELAKSEDQQVNLLDPILTSRDKDKEHTRCPVMHTESASTANVVDVRENSVAKCPVLHDSVADSSAAVEIDYLKFADYVDKWMEEQ
ncbi:hypothetical protein B484DRAFT_442458 [Ochromonadaceae sp. CCMP2298]|nr:hypothetical protein B484DRAFT_442458 [Ochromonadaceae sp. CCMP2298]|mmetsp:Transcript_29227/g.64873  ORF Transcript_29227/g.64873 Transcript_29227/m.64873 type:complete len:465 (-) Transcript_29227:59-1453(-)